MIHHSRYLEDITAPDMVRELVAFLTVWEPKAGYMWETVEHRDDGKDSEDIELGTSLCYILKKNTTSVPDEAPMYVKIYLDSAGISVNISSDYVPGSDDVLDETDPHAPSLTGSIWSRTDSVPSSQYFRCNAPEGEENTAQSSEESEVVPRIVFSPEEWDETINAVVFKKVWMIRKLDPFLDTVGERKNTDIYFWVSACVKETGEDPVSRRGWYHHMTAGVCGEVLVPDTNPAHGPGLYASTGSYAVPEITADMYETGQEPEQVFDHTYVGSAGAPGPSKAISTYVHIGELDNVRTIFVPGDMYGLGRPPFDENMFTDGARNVGFDYTELCKYSPYSGVRVLTPAYMYGYFDSLWRILVRLPIFYTDMAGLYSGDTITQIVDTETRNYLIFPFITYRCAGSVECKRGYAVLVPNDEDI